MTVHWRGQSAVYTKGERQIMRSLPIKEQAFVHLLKSTTDGEISELEGRARSSAERITLQLQGHGADTGVDRPVDRAQFTFTDPEATGKSDTNPASDGNIPLYTDPEDIPFGKSVPFSVRKRRPKIYAVAWSWRKHKIHKTKKRCEERLKVWKAWKERQGFTVIRMGSGYMGILGEKREVIQLHEYDRETHERLV